MGPAAAAGMAHLLRGYQTCVEHPCESAGESLLKRIIAEKLVREAFPEFVPESLTWTDCRSRPGEQISVSEKKISVESAKFSRNRSTAPPSPNAENPCAGGGGGLLGSGIISHTDTLFPRTLHRSSNLHREQRNVNLSPEL